MEFRTKFGLIVAAVVTTLFMAFFLTGLDRLWNAGDDPYSFVTWVVTSLGLLFIIMIILALVISAVVWGYLLGDFGNGGRRRRSPDGDEEARQALELLEQKYARHEITMTEYLQLRKGIDRDRPKY